MGWLNNNWERIIPVLCKNRKIKRHRDIDKPQNQNLWSSWRPYLANNCKVNSRPLGHKKVSADTGDCLVSAAWHCSLHHEPVSHAAALSSSPAQKINPWPCYHKTDRRPVPVISQAQIQAEGRSKLYWQKPGASVWGFTVSNLQSLRRIFNIRSLTAEIFYTYI